MSGNSKTPPMMESCSITSMHITTLGRPENGAEISFQSTFKGMEANGKPWGIEVTVKLRGADDTLYDIAATAQSSRFPTARAIKKPSSIYPGKALQGFSTSSGRTSCRPQRAALMGR